MEQLREGLNYVPMLTQSLTPPSSGRSRISLNRNRSQRSIIYYNGNYEGDNSMFREKIYDLERLSLVDSESDTEAVSSHLTFVGRVKSKEYQQESSSLIWRLMEFLLIKFIKPKMSEKALLCFEQFHQSSLCHQLTKLLKLFSLALTYISYFGLVLTKNLAIVLKFFWTQRIVFHNLVRRLLWRLTLAKCSDQFLFIYVLLSVPLLLSLSLIGFIISICGGLKHIFHYGIHTFKKI